MARCGCSKACTCLVTAGAHVTVTGNGSSGNPYVVSAEAAAVTVADTGSIDASISGTGTVADPYIISGVVIPSADANNCTVISPTDGGVFTPCPTPTVVLADPATPSITVTEGPTGTFTISDADAAGTAVVVQPGPDTATFHPTVVESPVGTFTVDGDVIVSPDAGNTLVAHANGLFVPASTDVDDPVSTDAGNIITHGSDGQAFLDCAAVVACIPADVDPLTLVTVADTPSLDLSISGTGAAGDPYIISGVATGGAATVVTGDGTTATVTGSGTVGDPYVVHSIPETDVDPTVAVTDTGTVDMTVSAGPNYVLSSAVKFSADAGNQATTGSDGGVFVPPDVDPPVSVVALDTDCINTTVTEGPAGTFTVSADPIIAPGRRCRPQLLACDPAEGGLIASPKVAFYSAQRTAATVAAVVLGGGRNGHAEVVVFDTVVDNQSPTYFTAQPNGCITVNCSGFYYVKARVGNTGATGTAIVGGRVRGAGQLTALTVGFDMNDFSHSVVLSAPADGPEFEGSGMQFFNAGDQICIDAEIYTSAAGGTVNNFNANIDITYFGTAL